MVFIEFFIGLVVGVAVAATFPKMTLALHERMKEMSKRKIDPQEVSQALSQQK